MFLILLLLLVSIITYYNFYYKRKHLPPGPTPLPILGNILTIVAADSPEDAFLKWRSEYGSIYTYWQGEDPIVAFTDFDCIQTAFKKNGDAFAGRPDTHEFHRLTRGGNLGIIESEEEFWYNQRKFAIQVLRDFGLGKNLMQDRILEEVYDILEKFQSNIGVKMQITEYLDVAIGSIINSILFGYRFNDTNIEEFRELKTLIGIFFSNMGNPLLLPSINNAAIFSRVPVFRTVFKRVQYAHHRMLEVFQQQIDRHRKNLAEEDFGEPNDFLDAFLMEAQKREKDCLDFSDAQLINVCFDLWIAGQETTSTTLNWGLAYMVRHPEVQTKLHAELDSVIGGIDKIITVESRPMLPYTNAVIAEIQRIANLVPQNILHRTTKEVQVGKFTIPKYCSVVPQISAVLYDPNVFPDPRVFRPDRFIDANGEFRKCDELIPFSIGKRQCMGESMARMELFLFIANIFNRFRFLSADKLPSTTRLFGATSPCPDFECRIELRQPA